MRETLKIKIDFANERRRPEEVFQAMSDYIEAYQALGQVISKSLNEKTPFLLQLEKVEAGSVASLLKAIPSAISERLETWIFELSMKLADSLSEIDETKTEEDVNDLASKIEGNLEKLDIDQLFCPEIDRKALAHALKKLSDANRKLLPNEKALASTQRNGQVININTHWRFNADPKEMFQGKTETKACTDKLYVRTPVNFGKGTWSVLSSSTDRVYNAKIMDSTWLEQYQSGLIHAIGPKDVMEAELILEIYTPPVGKGKPFITSAKILRVLHIHRDVGLKNEKPLI